MNIYTKELKNSKTPAPLKVRRFFNLRIVSSLGGEGWGLQENSEELEF